MSKTLEDASDAELQAIIEQEKASSRPGSEFTGLSLPHVTHELAKRLVDKLTDTDISCVISCESESDVLSYEIARQLDARGVRMWEDLGRFYCDHEFKADDRALLVIVDSDRDVLVDAAKTITSNTGANLVALVTLDSSIARDDIPQVSFPFTS